MRLSKVGIGMRLITLPMHCIYILVQDSLFYLAFEKVKVDEKSMDVHLWSYRPQINLQHLESTLKTGSKYKILEAFLTAVSLHTVTVTVFL